MSTTGEGTPAEVLTRVADWAVLHGRWETFLPMLPDRSLEHVITDAPYEAEAHTKQRRIFNGGADRGGGIKAAPLGFDPITPAERRAVAREWARVARGWVMTFCQIEAVALWRASMRRAGSQWVRGQVWRKANGQPQMTGDRPGMGFECIATAWNGQGRMSWNGGGRHGWYDHPVDANFSTCERVHETQKPISLMLELVRLFTQPGDVVLDCYAGSGTTGLACMMLGRRFIGIERDAKYAAIARDRIAGGPTSLERGGQRPLFGPESGDLFNP